MKLLKLFTIGLLLCGSGTSAMADGPLQGIHVSGRGEVLVEPDMAHMTLQVQRQGRDAIALKKEIDSVTATVLKLTDSLGIPRKDVTAAIVNIYPRSRRENNQSVMDGVNASRTITITLRDLQKIGKLMNGALELGINSIGAVQLDTSKRVELQQQALKLAIDDAKSEAQRIADQFDVRLLGVLDVHAGSHAVQPRMMAEMRMDASAAGSFSPGEMTVSRDVQATFAISAQ